MKHGKKYQDSSKLFDSAKLYDTAEAIDLCTKTAKAKFDETVEAHIRLGVTLTSRFVAQLYCPTVPVRPFAPSYSARARTWTRLWLPALTM